MKNRLSKILTITNFGTVQSGWSEFLGLVILFLVFIPGQILAQQTNTLTSEPIASLGNLEERLNQALDQDKNQKALEIFDEIFASERECELQKVIRYQEVVTESETKERIDEATTRYIDCLSRTTGESGRQNILKKEALYLKELLHEDDSEIIEETLNRSPAELANLIRQNWIKLDPTPGTVANERLLEHRFRIMEAGRRFPSDKSEIGLDDRGLIYLRYGAPDLIYDKPITITRGDLYSFASDYQFLIASQTPLTAQTGIDATSQSAAYLMVNRMEELMSYNPVSTGLNIWIYRDNGPETGESLIFYFTETGRQGYQQIESLEDWIPNGLYSTTRTAGGIPPALAIQYITYRRIMDLDPKFMEIYSDLDERIFNPAVKQNRVQIANMARMNRMERKDEIYLIHSNSPAQSTSDGESIASIPMDITQYRLLDSNLKPVLTTFIESDADDAFLMDYFRLKERLFGSEISDEEAISKMVDWYRFEQGVELYDSEMQMLGRIRGFPPLEVDTEDNTPTTMLMNVPVPQDDMQQIFYARFENRHPESDTTSTRFFPDELKGVGKEVVSQPDHFYTPGTNELMMGDLIIGYRRLDDDIARFPFVVSHERVIPEDENLVIHFEAYNLNSDEASPAEFEVQYHFEPHQARRGLFGSRKNVPEGTLEFTTYQDYFRESLEFENLSLEPGKYTLTWTVRQPEMNREAVQQIELEVLAE
jgi:GWxTD domain-containing protein